MEASSERLRRLREKVLTEPSVFRLVVWLAIPLIASTSVRTLYDIVDIFWVSRLGKEALGAPIVSWPYPDILFGVVFGLTASISALVGQYIGAGRFDEARRAAGTILTIILAITLPGSVAIAATAPLYLDAIRVPPDVWPLALQYLVIIALGMPFAAIFMYFFTLLSAAGDTRTPMRLSIASTVLNMILDPILIFGLLGLPAMGVAGAALATTIARLFAASYAVYSLVTGRHGFKIALRDLVPRQDILLSAFKVSAPVMGERLAMTFGFMVMAGVVSGLGTEVLAAYAIGQVILGFDHIIVMPLARSVSIIVAQSLGANVRERAREAVDVGLTLVSIVIGAYTVFMVVAAEAFASIFAEEENVIHVAAAMARIFGPSVLGFSLLTLANSVARGSGHTLLVSILGFARLWLLRIPLSVLLAYMLGMGHVGLWLGMALSNHVTGIASVAWLAIAKWDRPVIKPRVEAAAET